MDYKTERTSPIAELICPVCGKIFIPAPFHVYKVKAHGMVKKCCSYGCQVKHEKAHPRKLRS